MIAGLRLKYCKIGTKRIKSDFNFKVEMTNKKLASYDIFITHSWRYHEDWLRMGELLDGMSDLSWRNFSVPWHDPAMKPSTELGNQFICDNLENQIIPAHGVILLTGVYAVNSCRKWLDFELELARKYKKGVVGVAPYGATAFPMEMRPLCDRAVEWNAGKIIDAIDELMGDI